MRLDKYIAVSASLSRKTARQQIGRGRVGMNGEVVRRPEQQIGASDLVTLDERTLHYQEHVYLMLNKPPGYICSTQDELHPSVLNLLPEALRRRDLHVVGRLDVDVTGLVLLTDDGAWSHRVTAPARKQPKVYVAETTEDLDPLLVETFSQGILLHGKSKATRPAELRIVMPRTAELTICEGRYHQVKRMFAAVDNPVVSLRRRRIGGLELDPALAQGESRELTETEVECIFLDVSG